MSEYDVIEYQPRQLTLGALPVQGPTEIIQRASEVASALAEIVEQQKLYTLISGKKFVRVEGWNTLGAMLGILPREVLEHTHRVEVDGTPGYEAFVELINPNTGATVGGASAICTRGEKNWSKRDDYAIRSMAVTRATGKAFRLGFSWIMALAGYEPTPAEEMPDDGHKPTQKTARKTPNGNGGDVPDTLPPEKWHDIPIPADYTVLWGAKMWALIGYTNEHHAKNTIKGHKFEDASTCWAFLLQHQLDKLDEQRSKQPEQATA